MRTMTLRYGLALGAALLAAQPARADTTTTPNTKVTSSGINFNGLNFGTGNTNGGFNVVTYTSGNNSVEIGLRAQLRSPSLPGYITPDGGKTATYTVPTGDVLNSGLLLGLWNYTYSVELNGYSFASTDPNPLTAVVSITNGTQTPTAFNLVMVGDNNRGSGYMGSNTLLAPLAYEIQNSENLAFPGVGLAGFNPNALDNYTITLTVYDGATALASDTIYVDAVPEPASAAMFAVGLLGFGLLWRRQGRTFFF